MVSIRFNRTPRKYHQPAPKADLFSWRIAATARAAACAALFVSGCAVAGFMRTRTRRHPQTHTRSQINVNAACFALVSISQRHERRAQRNNELVNLNVVIGAAATTTTSAHADRRCTRKRAVLSTAAATETYILRGC